MSSISFLSRDDAGRSQIESFAADVFDDKPDGKDVFLECNPQGSDAPPKICDTTTSSLKIFHDQRSVATLVNAALGASVAQPHAPKQNASLNVASAPPEPGLEPRVSKLETGVKTLDTRLDKQELVNQGQGSTIDKIEIRLANVEKSGNTALEPRVSKLETNVKTLDTRQDRSDTVNQTQTANISAQQTALTKLGQEHDAAFKNHETRLDKQELVNQRQSSAIDTIEVRLGNMDKTDDANRFAIEKVDARLYDLNRTFSRDISKLEEKQARTSELVASLQVYVSQAVSDIETLKATVSQFNLRLNSAEEKITQNTGGVDLLRTELTAIEARLKIIESKFPEPPKPTPILEETSGL